MKWLAVAHVMLAITGCGTLPISSKNYSAGDTIPPGYGIVMTHLYSNWPHNDPEKVESTILYWVRSADDKSSRYFALRMKHMDDQKLIPIPEGHYLVTSLRMGNYFLPFTEVSAFDIKAGQITYIGDINTEIFILPAYSARCTVSFKPDEAKQLLQKEYPDLLKNTKFNTQQLQLVTNK